MQMMVCNTKLIEINMQSIIFPCWGIRNSLVKSIQCLNCIFEFVGVVETLDNYIKTGFREKSVFDWGSNQATPGKMIRVTMGFHGVGQKPIV